MANKPKLLDRFGNPVQRMQLTQEVAAPTIGGVRSPISGYPADGLNPLRLAAILREADLGDPLRYLELAETIEERDPHYLGVIGTRKRSVSQIEITVKPGGESPADENMAEMVRNWLDRDELADEIFDILDALGKGYSFTEIIWERSEGQWMPSRLEWRDPRWFRFERHNLATPLLIDENGQERPLDGFKFIFAAMKAKSGLVARSGLARVASWGWMFKAYTQRDWAIFTQTYGQPLRVGKFGAGASEADRDTLFRAVSNIAGDCAAIIPESMTIDFIEGGNIGAAHQLYLERSDWLDKQISKAVLGQTATTDAVTGGLGSGKEHREVQEDIERADCIKLAAILNRDLIRPWVQLEYGPQKVYPRLVIARPDEEDLAAFSTALAPLVERGLRVRQSEIRAKFGLSAPDDGDEILGPSPQSDPKPQVAPPGTGDISLQSAVKYPFNTLSGRAGPLTALAAEGASAGRSASEAPEELLSDRLAKEAAPHMEAMLGQIEAMMGAARSIEEFREMLLAGFPDLDADDLVQVMAQALTAADLGGRAAVEQESG
ncbi:DUF935 domain-containing protein [Antarcticimicrobium sediminis]|uniref:DUF935 domain-containing protein n=1 Tax=Antarcticimicrobium sediminis TaxID=2546227 RepID=A0A4R5F0E4_9RHOB|nr:DUF935 domain-containing protein [Antarcticimicrobium sediminis]TDE40935.1 DUF935 domain-containing protein [Antarcticimicrobium sediminis]